MGKIGQILRFLIPVIAPGVLVVFLTGAATRLERNKAIVMHIGEEVWNKGDTGVADEILASNYIRHEDAAPGGAIRGREAMKKWVMAVRTGIPDWHMTVLDMFVQGDKVVARYEIRGTFKGELLGIPPNGKEIAFEEVVIYRIVGGKIVEDWLYLQDLVLFSQMGMKLVPAEQAGK